MTRLVANFSIKQHNSNKRLIDTLMPTPELPNAASAGTREKILDAAEQLLIEKGCGGTSLRAIASNANVNLAATNYHFGGKEGLFAAVIHRCARPINEQRLASLDMLEAQQSNISTREILKALLDPLASNNLPEHLPAVMNRVTSEPDENLRAIVQAEFSEVSSRFIAALTRAIPQVEEEEISLRFYFVIGSMLHLVGLFGPLTTAENDNTRTQKINALVNFGVAGLETESPTNIHSQGTSE